MPKTIDWTDGNKHVFPPRNCSRFQTAEDAKKEFNYLWNFVWKRGGGCVDEHEYRSEYEKWLFSPIQEGDNHAQND